MNRWIWFAFCALLALGLVAWGMLVPIHLRAVEPAVLQRAGNNSFSAVAHGIELAREGRIGAAKLILQALDQGKVRDADKLRATIASLAASQTALTVSGGDASPRMERLFASDPQPPKNGFESVAEFVIRLENREVVLGLLRSSANADVQQLLRCRALTNTAIFSPSMSASGQAFDAALSIAGLLIDENRMAPQLREKISALAAAANKGADSQPLEQTLLDLMSLGQRFNWGQLVAFVGRIQDTDTLRILAEESRNDFRLPTLFAAVEMSGQPSAVAQYLTKFSQTGGGDLAASVRYGPRSVKELLHRNQRIVHVSPNAVAASAFVSPFWEFAVNTAYYNPGLAFFMKWFAYLSAGFLLALSFHFVQPELPAIEAKIQARGFGIAREMLFALGFLLVVLLLSEPFLAQENQKMTLPVFRLAMPTVGSVVPAGTHQTRFQIMNQSLLTMLLFFVLQGFLYVGSLLKLAEIRRQNAPPRTKLKLLENEDHLFDAGLYLGFLGTIVCFILHSLHQVELSLMGAYSSTSFGIVFVSIFKIFQLRPARRKLLLEAESVEQNAPVTPASRPALATMP